MAGGANKDAEINVGISGVDDVAGAADRALSPWERRGEQVAHGLQKGFGAVGEAISDVATDIARVSTVMASLDLAGSANSYRTYTDQVTRYSVAAGTSVQELRKRFAELEEKTALPDERIARFSQSLQRSTHDAGNSSGAIKALNDEAIATGRTLEEMAPLGTVLHNSLGVAFDKMPAALEAIRNSTDGSAESVATLQQQFVALGGTFAHLATGDIQRLAATMSALGKGLPPELQKEVQQRVVGRLMANPEGLRHQLGMKREDFYDQYGRQRVDADFLTKVRGAAVRRWGKNALDVLSQSQNFGPMAARALMSFEAPPEGGVHGNGPSAAAAATQYLGSEAGRDARLRAEIERKKRDEAGKDIAGVQGWVGDLIKDHPVLGAVGAQVGLRLGAAGLKALLAGGGEGGGSVAGSALTSGLTSLGGGSVGAGGLIAGGTLAGAAATMALTVAAVNPLNKAMPQIRSETEDQLFGMQLGRVRAMVHAGEQAAGTSPEEFAAQLGPTLDAMTAARNQSLPGYDPQLAAVRRGLETGEVKTSELGPEIAKALVEALKASPLQVAVHVTDDTDNPVNVTARSQGAPQ